MNAVVRAWDRFWFAPASTSTLGVFRIVYGVVVLCWAVALVGDGHDFFSRLGVLPSPPDRPYRFTIFNIIDSDIAITGMFVAVIIGAICVAIGYRTRIATIVVFVVILSLCRRNEYFVNGGDVMLRCIAFYMMFAPAGVALSVDGWRRDRGGFWSFPLRSPWTMRLVQVQVAIVYLFSAWTKAQGPRWTNGTAVASSLRVADIVRFELPQAVTDSLLLANLLSYGTIAVELALAVLIWDRRLRPWVIGLGVALHLFIEVTFALAFFGFVMIFSYISFVPPDAMDRWITGFRERMKTSRVAVLRRIANVDDAGAPPSAPETATA